MKSGIILLTMLMLAACDTIGGWADDVGEHLPVIGERCEHWQCMTTSGQQRSEQIRRQKEQSGPPSASRPTSVPAAPEAPPEPAQEPEAAH